MKVPKRGTDGDEPHVHDRFLQIEAEAVELANGVERLLVIAALLDKLANRAADRGDLAGEVEHAIELVDADAQAACRT